MLILNCDFFGLEQKVKKEAKGKVKVEVKSETVEPVSAGEVMQNLLMMMARQISDASVNGGGGDAGAKRDDTST